MRDCDDCRTGTPCVDHCRICTTPVNRDCPSHPDLIADDLDLLFGPLRLDLDEAIARSQKLVVELKTLVAQLRAEVAA